MAQTGGLAIQAPTRGDRPMRQIVTFGGGGFSMEAGNPLLDEFVLELTGRPRPRVCFLPSASGDADHYIVRFYRHFQASRCDPSHLSLFRRERAPAEPREHLLSQDLIYVGGGSVTSLIGVWRAHGIDRILREAWERGIILCGLSAGSLCWFREGVSTFHGDPQRVAGSRPAPVEQHRPLLERADSPRGPVRLAQGRDADRLRRRRRRGPALHRRRPRAGGGVAAQRARLPGRAPPRRTSSPHSSPRVIWRTRTAFRWSVRSPRWRPS